MKAMFISDLHLHNYKPFSTLIYGENSRLIQICDSINVAFDIADKEGCTMAFVAGDIFHTRGNLKPSVIRAAHNVFKNKKQHIVMVAGNHDMESYDGGATAIEIFYGIENMTIYNTPEVVGIGETGQCAIVIPYIHDPKEFIRVFNSYRCHADKPAFFVIHQGIDDFTFKAGLPPSGINSEFLLKGHDAYVFAGHYHNAEIYNERAVQIGAICQHNFSDVDQKRGCWTFDTETKDLKFHPINVAPKFINIDKWTKETAELAKDNFVRVKGKTDAAVKKITSKLADVGVDYVISLEKEFTTAHDTAISIDRPLKMLSQYIDIQEDLTPFKTEILALYEVLSDETI